MENLRLIHDATGKVKRDAPMPKHNTFSAWLLAHNAISKARGLNLNATTTESAVPQLITEPSEEERKP